jgi:hypothetical protein
VVFCLPAKTTILGSSIRPTILFLTPLQIMFYFMLYWIGPHTEWSIIKLLNFVVRSMQGYKELPSANFNSFFNKFQFQITQMTLSNFMLTINPSFVFKSQLIICCSKCGQKKFIKYIENMRLSFTTSLKGKLCIWFGHKQR